MQRYPAYSLAQIELEANASKFAVFGAIRAAVLEGETKYALFQESETYKCSSLVDNSSCCSVCTGTCLTNNLVECSCHSAATASANEKKSRRDSVNSDADTETEDFVDKDVVVANVPFIVGAGLRSLFEIIADARHSQPVLCTKALKAVLDVIQGQTPESFKLEPDELINPLYDLLLDLATKPIAVSGSADTNWSAMACASLLGLCIARGDTGKIIRAVTALLMSPKQLYSQVIQLPMVLSSLQRTVVSAALNKPLKPDFLNYGVPYNSLVDQVMFHITISKIK